MIDVSTSPPTLQCSALSTWKATLWSPRTSPNFLLTPVPLALVTFLTFPLPLFLSPPLLWVVAGIEIIGEVLYVASGTLSQVNMYNISNNLEELGVFVTFVEGFFIETLSYDPIGNVMYAGCDDYPFVLKV